MMHLLCNKVGTFGFTDNLCDATEAIRRGGLVLTVKWLAGCLLVLSNELFNCPSSISFNMKIFKGGNPLYYGNNLGGSHNTC